MSDVLERAKALQLDQAKGAWVQIRLSFLQEMILEMERLEAIIRAGGNRTELLEQFERNGDDQGAG